MTGAKVVDEFSSIFLLFYSFEIRFVTKEDFLNFVKKDLDSMSTEFPHFHREDNLRILDEIFEKIDEMFRWRRIKENFPKRFSNVEMFV